MEIRNISRRRPRSAQDAELGHITLLGSLRSYYGDADENVVKKMNLYFTYESRDTLKSFTLLITVQAIEKLNLGHRNKFEIEI